MNKKSILTILTTCVIAFTSHVALADKPNKDGGPKGGADKGGPDAKAVFDAIDANDDGKITAKELGGSKKFKGADKKEVGEAFSKKDLDGDGAISPKEFGKTFGGKDKGGKGAKVGKGGKGGKGGGKGGKGGGKGKG